MGQHCPTCTCSSCRTENRYSEITGPITYIDRDGNRIQNGRIVGHQSQVNTSNDWINERNISDRPQEQTIWRKGQPNYPGSWEGSQAISHVTRQPNTNPNGVGHIQTYYRDGSLPPQNIQGFQQTYHRDPSQQWERMPDSPLPEEMQREVNRQMHGLAEQLGRQYGAQNVQVHQAFITPDQLTPEQIRQLPPEQQQQIRRYQQQLSRQEQPKQGFWDRLKGRQPEQTQLVRSPNQQLPAPAPKQQLQEKAVLLFKEMFIAKRQIGVDNDRYRQAVLAANEQIKQKQGEAIAVATQAIATATTAQEKFDAVSARLNLATKQPKLLSPAQGEKADVRMGQKQPRQNPSLYAAERSDRATRNPDRNLYLPESRAVEANPSRNQRSKTESARHRESHRLFN